ncbi:MULTISPECIES: CRTAC1 family protein [Micromonospora]|uniref:RNA-binding protein n=2 Tax=Micromonospora TaxID=1873 RepID=A0A9X0I041_9ACTN|nr:CRTAC1 family protein [Micromonospora maris]KUJ44266.1 RNA-binding protein [Micromonospora maris]
MSMTIGLLRRQLAGIIGLALVVGMFFAVRLPSASAAERTELASRYAFEPMGIALPASKHQQTVRKVNQTYTHIDAWISSVGAGIAMNDLDGDGLANDLCITDPRTDQTIVTPTPGLGEQRYQPFALDAAPLPISRITAPMGCAPGDFNEDGRMDLLVYYWARTPILFLNNGKELSSGTAAYRPVELVPGVGVGEYNGPLWNTNAVAIDDFDGDGHVDIYVGNYFPHSPVLDDTVKGGVEMNDSMSYGLNGGEDYVFRFTEGTGGAEPTAVFQRVDNVIPHSASKGWALAAAAVDLDGDLLPELYLAHDFGPDRLLYNRSTPGNIEFALVQGARSATIPKSKVLGRDSFKGMGADFGDIDGDGLYDLFVSNITTPFGIQESNYTFMNTAADQSGVKTAFSSGKAPFRDRSADLGLAWSGWGWDVKMADFDNGGRLAIAQATGFVRGEVNRWPQLQELATTNDTLVRHTSWWPNVRPGDDIGGSQRLHFFVEGKDGRYVNIAPELGLDIPLPTRGIATGDADGDGRLDMAVARQWAEPIFYRNTSPDAGAFLGLRLTHETADPATTGSPAVGAQVMVTTPDGRKFVSRVDGGGGHSGKRSNEVHIGLGAEVTGSVQVTLCWRDRTGQIRKQDLQLTPGWHDVQLGSQANER